MNMNKAINQYAKVNKQTAIEDANPHQLICMLYDGAVDNLTKAKGCLMRKDFAGKGENIGRAITIIGGLQGFLDMDQGGDIAKNLDALYDYMSKRLYEVTRDNDLVVLDEVISLLKEVREGWVGIATEAAQIFESSKKGE